MGVLYLVLELVAIVLLPFLRMLLAALFPLSNLDMLAFPKSRQMSVFCLHCFYLWYICRYLAKDSMSILGHVVWLSLSTLSLGQASFTEITAVFMCLDYLKEKLELENDSRKLISPNILCAAGGGCWVGIVFAKHYSICCLATYAVVLFRSSIY